MAMPKLLVRARGATLVDRFETLGVSIHKQFIGRKYDPAHGEHGGGGWPAVDETVEVPSLKPGSEHYAAVWTEYARCLAQGVLWAGDKATADAASGIFDGAIVKFDPDFGGEFAAEKTAEQPAPAITHDHEEHS